MPENIGTNNTLIQGNISINDGNRTKKIGTGFFLRVFIFQDRLKAVHFGIISFM